MPYRRRAAGGKGGRYMAGLNGKIREFYTLEQLSGGSTVIHRLHPGAKLLTTLVFIVTVVSFDRLQFRQLIPFLFYPALLMGLSETPWGLAMKRVALALPFVVLAGLSNVIFDREPVLALGSVVLTGGVISFASILLRTFLTVISLVLLIGVTPFSDLTGTLRRAHIPELLVTLFEMTYRYIGVLLEETSSMYTAYQLRHQKAKGLELRHMGSFVGSLLLRTFDRAGRIYSAMKCRGYGRNTGGAMARPWAVKDWAYTLTVSGLCVLCRVFDVVTLAGSWIGGLLP